MSYKDVYWSFYHEEDGLSEDGLTFGQAQFVYKLIPARDRLGWLVWCEEWTDWLPLDECGMLGLREQKMRLPPSPPVVKSKTKLSSESAGELLSNAETQQMNRRLTRRFVKYYRAEISGDGKVFQTTTINLSMGGLLLQDPVPPDLGVKVKVRLTRKNGDEVEMFCAVIKTAKGPSLATRLRIVNIEKEGVLRSWLIDPENS